MWNSPYGQTFYELLSSYTNGQFIVNSPYTLWLPKLVKKENNLKKDFEDFGIDYDAPGTFRTALKKAAEFQLRSMAVGAQIATPSGARKSERVRDAKKIADKAEKTALRDKVTKLLKRREEIIEGKDNIAKREYRLGLIVSSSSFY